MVAGKVAVAFVLALAVIVSAKPSPRRKEDVTTAVLKTPLPAGTNWWGAPDRKAYLTLTELGVNVTTNSAYFSWELVGDSVFNTSLPAPASLGIYAYRPNWPVTNGDLILNLAPAEGYAIQPMWSNFTLAQLNDGRIRAGLPPAVLDTDWENGNGTLVNFGADMVYAMVFADGHYIAGLGSWVSELPPGEPESEDTYFGCEVNTNSTLPGLTSWTQGGALDYWTLYLNDNEDGTYGTTFVTVTNTTGLTTTAVKLVALKNNAPVTVLDISTKVNIQASLEFAGSDVTNAFTRAELSTGMKTAGFTATTELMLLITSTYNGVTYTNVASMDPVWTVDPNSDGNTDGPSTSIDDIVCDFSGNYRLESVICPGKFIGISKGCNKATVSLRTGKQAPGDRIKWTFETSSAGLTSDPTTIVSVSRSTCSNNSKYLAAKPGKGPGISSSDTHTFQIVTAGENCDIVNIISDSRTEKELPAYLSTDWNCAKGGSSLKWGSSNGRLTQWKVVSA